MNKRGKSLDKTFLSLDIAESRGFIHRDYLAHCLRWSHVVRFLMQGQRYKTAKVLDIGCGREVPMAKLMFSSRMTHTTGSYTGVDAGPIDYPETISRETKKFKMKLFSQTDVVQLSETSRVKYDVISCFEVLEHVEPYHTFQILKATNKMLKSRGGTAFFSTPVYDPRVGAADNHVNEMSREALQVLLRLAGLSVTGNWGTFASQRDYKHHLRTHELVLFDALKSYYDSNVIACLFAPLYPELSRNNMWRVKRCKPQPPSIEDCANTIDDEASSSSSQRFEDFRRILEECS